jgi:hypothetical protein
MYYQDLMPYEYIKELAEPGLLNVGWLEAKYDYPTGNVTEEFLDQLFQLCLQPVNATRGFHECPFCERPSFGLKVSWGGKDLTLGSAEIRAQGRDGISYAAPDLIFHYVEAHGYQPPAEFINAVLRQASCCSTIFCLTLLKQIGVALNWR